MVPQSEGKKKQVLLNKSVTVNPTPSSKLEAIWRQRQERQESILMPRNTQDSHYTFILSTLVRECYHNVHKGQQQIKYNNQASYIFDSPVHCDLVESTPRGFQLLVKRQGDQHMHAKVLNLELVFPLQNPTPNVIKHGIKRTHNKNTLILAYALAKSKIL